MTDAYLYFDQGPYIPEVEAFLDWVDQQTTDTLQTLDDFIPQVIQQLEIYAVVMPLYLHQRLTPILLRLRAL